MATSEIPQVSKTWNCSSFQTNSFDYQWTITEAKTRLSVPEALESPYFYPDFKVYMTYHKAGYPPTGSDTGMRAGVVATVDGNSPPYSEVHVQYLPRNYHFNTTSNSLIQTVVISYGTLIGIEQHTKLNKVTTAIFNNTLTVYCKVDIYMLKHPTNKLIASSSPMIQEPAFNLGETMEEARKHNLFTDVTLVAGDKEFKAHRAILASQSPFFKTRFEQHWQRDDNKVEMSDLTPDILEAMISFMYTGKVPNTDTLAFQLLPAAEEYGLVGLRSLCERVLSGSLNAQNVIQNIILADTHNADGLKSACMSYITKNPSEAQKSEGWKQMKTTRDRESLRVEILDAIAESLIK